MYGPRITGKLVTLRPPRLEDAVEFMLYFEDVEVTRYLSRRTPPSLEDEQEFLRKRDTDPDSLIWSVEYEGRLVGVAGFDHIHWENQYAIAGTLIGDKSVWGQSLATELMQLRRDFAFTHYPFRKLQSGYLGGNEGSAKAQANAGMKIVGRMQGEFFREGQWRDPILTELTRPDWEAIMAAQ